MDEDKIEEQIANDTGIDSENVHVNLTLTDEEREKLQMYQNSMSIGYILNRPITAMRNDRDLLIAVLWFSLTMMVTIGILYMNMPILLIFFAIIYIIYGVYVFYTEHGE